MKKILIFILIIVAAHVKGQQLPQYSQYMINDYVLNPAIGGSKGYFEAKSDNRYQWQGITDAPRTYILSVHGPTKSQKVGIGGQLFTDVTGPTRRNGFKMSYAYHFKPDDNVTLAMGISGGILQYLVDAAKITVLDGGDVALSNASQSVVVPDFDFGIYAYSKKFYVGIAMPQLIQNKLRFFDYNKKPLSRLEAHYFAMAGYKYDINEDFQVEPSVLMKMVNPVPVQFDFGTKLTYKQRFWIGGAYRTKDAISALVGFTFENILFGYSYDFTSSNLKNYSSGTHEFMIGLKFIQEAKPSKSSIN